jgi:hypothetical protein
MEGLTPNSAYLKNLRYQVRELAAASLSLSNLFAEEAVRLNRRDEASRLEALYLSIRQQLERAKSNEDAASYGHNKTNLKVSLGKLVVGGTIKMVSKNEQLLAFSDYLLNGLGGAQRPFGTVLICVGPKGVPDDVHVVSISWLARESNLEESEVISELQGHGCLLFSEKAFSLLIDRLTCDVQEGRVFLPIPAEKLTEIDTSSCLKLVVKKSG